MRYAPWLMDYGNLRLPEFYRPATPATAARRRRYGFFPLEAATPRRYVPPLQDADSPRGAKATHQRGAPAGDA